MVVPSYSTDELKKISETFTHELLDAQHGAKNSIAFIRNPFPPRSLVPDGQFFQAISIGGSHLESALFQKKNGELIMLGHRHTTLPRLDTKEILYPFIHIELSPYCDAIGLNFAYPLEPFMRDGLLDGKLIRGNKEHELRGLVGKAVGEELEKHVWEIQKRKVKVSVANDTVCVVLSGFIEEHKHNLVGGIVGTGINFSLFLDDQTIINLESGAFDKFDSTETGVVVDKESVQPGTQKYEKEVAGGYLYKHYNALMKSLGLNGNQLSSTFELTQLAQNGAGKESQVAQEIISRSAKLIAAQMAGIFRFKQKERLTFVMEGSLYWEGWKYKDVVHDTLKDLGISEKMLKVIKVEKSNIMGAAGLV